MVLPALPAAPKHLATLCCKRCLVSGGGVGAASRAARTLVPWQHRRSARRSCCARSRSGRWTGCSTCTRPRAAGSARSRRACDETKSRFGGRLEPFSHVELSLHRGRGELATVTGASLVHSHDRVRSDPRRLQVGLVGLEAMLRLFTEEEHNERAFLALTRFLDALDEHEPARGARPGLDPLVLSFQLKLLWLSGSCRTSGAASSAERRRRSSRSTPGPAGRSAPGATTARSRSRRKASAGSLPCSGRRSPMPPRWARRSRVPRCARGRRLVVRAPRRLPPANARLASSPGRGSVAGARRSYPARAGGLHGAARRSRRCASAPPIEIRSWASVSRSRSVTVSSSSV